MFFLIVVIILIIGVLYYMGIFDSYLPDNYKSAVAYDKIKQVINSLSASISSMSKSAVQEAPPLTPQVLPTPVTVLTPQTLPPPMTPAQMQPVTVLYTPSPKVPSEVINQASYPYATPSTANAATLIAVPDKPIKLKNLLKQNICAGYTGDKFLQKQTCDDNATGQRWLFNPNKTISFNYDNKVCLSSGAMQPNGANRVYASYCNSADPNQQWTYNEKNLSLLNLGANACLDDGGGDFAGINFFKVETCDSANYNQQYYKN